MLEHPILSYFGDTRSRSFPLVMFIGREPNTSLTIGQDIGPYDFRDHYPKGKFWDNAYGVLAEAADSTGWHLKRLCIRSNASPIVFGNALPIGIVSTVRDKRTDRKVITPEEAVKHVGNIFAQDELLIRVQMVIASGLDSTEFLASRRAIEVKCRERRKHLTQIPFLYGGNRPKIRLALTDADRVKMREIYKIFEEHARQEVNTPNTGPQPDGTAGATPHG
jgi:hypothetical protein